VNKIEQRATVLVSLMCGWQYCWRSNGDSVDAVDCGIASGVLPDTVRCRTSVRIVQSVSNSSKN